MLNAGDKLLGRSQQGMYTMLTKEWNRLGSKGKATTGLRIKGRRGKKDDGNQPNYGSWIWWWAACTACLCDDGSSRLSNSSRCRGSSAVTVHLCLWALSRDVSSFATTVARLSGLVQGTAVGSSTVTGNVTQLATSVTFHRLGLAVACIVVWPTTLIAGCCARSSESSAKASAIATSHRWDAAASTSIGTRALQAIRFILR
jgi:hypothetical protein